MVLKSNKSKTIPTGEKYPLIRGFENDSLERKANRGSSNLFILYFQLLTFNFELSTLQVLLSNFLNWDWICSISTVSEMPMPASIVPSKPLITNNSSGKPLPKRIAVALHNAKPDTAMAMLIAI